MTGCPYGGDTGEARRYNKKAGRASLAGFVMCIQFVADYRLSSVSQYAIRTGSLSIGHDLNIFDHFPDSARANAGAETASDTLGLVHHVLVGPVWELPACDGTVVARLFAHAAIPA